MPQQSKSKLEQMEKLQKARESKEAKRIEAKEQEQQALIDENRRVLEENRRLLEENHQLREENRQLREGRLPCTPLPRLGKGQTMCDKSKTIVCRALQFAKKQHEQTALEWTSNVTGIGTRSISDYEQKINIDLVPISVEDGTIAFKLPPCSSAPKSSFKDRVIESISDEGMRFIERAIDDVHLSGKPVTLKKLLDTLSPDLLSGSALTVKKLSIILHHMRYTYRQINNRPVLFENDPVINLRKKYTERIRQLRADGYQIFYLDETWIFQGMSHKRDWQNHYTPLEKKMKRLSSGPAAPPDHGKRAIVVHTVGRDGLVEGALKIMLGQRKDGDYHHEMNAQVFEEYIENLIPLLKAKGDKVALVMDNASYHSRCLERIPTMADKKDVIRNFLHRYGVEFEEAPKRTLISLVKELVRGKEKDFRRGAVDEMCKNNGIRLLRLPPYHANFNPIEFVWGWVKNEVRKIARMNDSIAAMKQHTKDFMDGIPLAHIEKFFDHVINEENALEAFDNFNIDDLDHEEIE
uniref:DDE_3 domain-containing protein n=2 Tax=Steinernema glaseri TaxID=37863 RepID=A0A1I7ZNC5_9BILA